MTKIYVSLICIAFFFAAHGQTQDKPPGASLAGGGSFQLSLQQAVDYAYQHQNSMLNARLDEEMAYAKVKEIRGAGYPQITGSLDVKDYIQFPTSVIPKSIFDPTAGPKELEKFPFIATKYNATAGLNASQLIFDPSFIVGLQAANSISEFSKKNTIRTKIEVASAVSKAYYGVLVNSARIQLINANVDRLKKLNDDTKAMYENGFVEKIDYDRVALTYNNVVTEKQNVERQMELSNYLLKYQMGMDINAGLVLTDSLNAGEVKNISVSVEKPDVSKRIEYSILETSKTLHYLDAKRYKVGYIPSIFAYGGIGANAYRFDFDIFSPSAPWYSNSLIGATITWNLFDGLQRQARARQATLEMKKTENDINNLQNGLALEVNNARTNLQNAIASFNTQEKNLNLATEVSNVTKIKYEQGVGSNLEVITAETSLKEAQTNYYSALYDALVAKLDLDKALGNIK